MTDDVYSLFSPCAVVLVKVGCVLKELEFFITKQLAKWTQPLMY